MFPVNSGILARASTQLVTCLALSSIISCYLGQDANFDLRNYHFFNAWSFLTGNTNDFLAPVGEQSYFNPLLDLPYYLMISGPLNDYPALVAALQGLYAGLLLFLILRLNLIIFRDRLPISLLATSVGFLGASTYSQIGTTFNEMQLAVLVVAGLLVVITSQRSDGRMPFVVAGILAGTATGLKLTAATYAIALLFTIISIHAFNAKLISKSSYFVFGCAVGFIAFALYWYYLVFDLLGNPIFPYYNAFFRSDFYPYFNPSDDRFKAHGFVDIIKIPYHLAAGSVGVTSEVYVRDPRLLVTISAVALLAVPSFRRGVFRSGNSSVDQRSALGVSAFFISGYLVWVYQFGILRYAIPTEVVSGTIIVAVIGLLTNFSSHISSLLSMAIATVIVLTTSHPNWGRIPYGTRAVEVFWPALPPSVRIVIGGGPVSYTLPFADVQIRDVINPRLAHPGYKLLEHLQARVSESGPPIFVLFNSPPLPAGVGSLGSLGLRWDSQTCRSVRTSFEQDIKLCEATQPLNAVRTQGSRGLVELVDK